jgi:PmbA protein
LSNTLDLLNDLVTKAKRAGADAADALGVEGRSVSVAWRMSKLEKLEREERTDIGLRVFIGKRQAIVSSSDRSTASLNELVDRAVSMARAVPEDSYCGLAGLDELATSFADLDACDPEELGENTMLSMVQKAEEVALAVPGVTNSEGAEAGWSRSEIALAASNGFARAWAQSYASLSASVLAGEGTGMERDYDYTVAVYAKDLLSPEEIGRQAGERAVKRLGAKKMGTAKLPVIFDPRAARGMVGHLASGINGATVARGTTFLKDSMGEKIFAEGISIIDDPHRQRGLRSRPCDDEGVANQRRAVIDKGRLTTWFLDLRSARQLGLRSTGHASRGVGSMPSPSASNLWLEPGQATPAELMADIKSGFYVTELIGMGVNMITGDYSRGAAGFWIEDGKITFPVSEMTIAGHLKEMFLNLTPANDLELRFGVDSPTLRIDGLTVAGA